MTGNAFDLQVPANHYGESYDSPARLASYTEQLALVLAQAHPDDKLLEVGIGNGTLTTALRARGFGVVTVDIDGELRPDVVEDIRALPFPVTRFNGALAFEVLEHLPWSDVRIALHELRRVSIWVAVSVPNVGPAYTLHAHVPNALHVTRIALRRRVPLRDALWALTQREAWGRAGGTIEHVAAIPPLHQASHAFDGQHHWVLGEGGLEAGDFAALAAECGLPVTRQFRPVSHPSHHFFVMERR